MNGDNLGGIGGTPRNRPWGVHVLSDIYHWGISGSPDGKNWYIKPAHPYTGNRLKAAWWVLTGRAYALLWPQLGDMEKIMRLASCDTRRMAETGTGSGRSLSGAVPATQGDAK